MSIENPYPKLDTCKMTCEISDNVKGNLYCNDVFECPYRIFGQGIEAANEDWVAWAENKCTATGHGGYYNFHLRRDCPLCWAERKKEINQ